MSNLEKPIRPFAVHNLLQDETKSDRLCPRSVGDYRDAVICQKPPLGVTRFPSSGRIVAGLAALLSSPHSNADDAKRPADSAEHKARLKEVIDSIQTTGSYDLTYDELCFGSKLAWRNAARCIGRIQWRNLRVIDARDARTPSDMFEYLKEHISYATNGGNIRSCITVFPQRTEERLDYRVWNTELINYAGYRQPDGTILGDPMNLKLTEVCEQLGWRGRRTPHDVLPLVVQARGNPPEFFEIPKELALQIPLKHPKYDWFAEMGIQWFAMPAVSYMLFDCGGILFPASPFNGWYMSSEIAARDLTDSNRYSITKTVARKLGLDTSQNVNLWKDKVLLEITTAVLHSYSETGVTIVDHHTASEQFMSHLETEYKLRGGCPADWVWIVPPMSSSLTPVFHMEMINYKLKPSYEYQPAAWTSWAKFHETREKRVMTLATLAKITGSRRLTTLIGYDLDRSTIRLAVSLMMKVLEKRVKCTILYATETGKSRSFANKMAAMARQAFNVKVSFTLSGEMRTNQNGERFMGHVDSVGRVGTEMERFLAVNGYQPMKSPLMLCLPAATRKIHFRIYALDEYDLSWLPDEELVLLIASTFGNGDPPANGVSFYQTLKGTGLNINNNNNINNNKFSLRHIKYSVFALGSSSYETFCAFGADLDKTFSTLGGKRLYPMARGDELGGQEESFSKWSKDVLKVSCNAFSVVGSDIQARLDGMLGSLSTDTKWIANSYRYMAFTRDKKSPDEIRKGLEHIHQRKVSKVTLKERIQLQHTNSPNKTYLLALSTFNDNTLQYTPGDHLAIYPVNDSILVEKILSKIRSPPECDVPVQLESRSRKGQSDWTVDSRLPLATSLRTALTYYLDITSAPRRPLLAQLARLCQDKEGRSFLQKLAEDEATYNQWKNTTTPTLFDVLEKVPSLKLAPSFILSQLPTVKARYYSVSSSTQLYPGEVHLTISLIINDNNSGSMKYGLCSNWLNNIEPGNTINCFVRKVNTFSLPDDVNTPVIMVGNGCGIAPFRSFWQQRYADYKRGQNALGPMYLFYGCQHPDKNNLHHEERSRMVKTGIITKEYTAFSRLNKNKVYVQDLLRKYGGEIRRQLIDLSGHIYICGFSSMAEGVQDTIIKILKKECRLTETKAIEMLDKLKTSGRWHEDIFNSGEKKTITTNKRCHFRLAVGLTSVSPP
ncbi:hypothetical protein LSH36_12g26014 [Paralvinella palmiformis]|uniref:Nitric oxide synthase n=1 Tax=Paralvinella palmiformis TaxID=53620 RepID=A0AAD9KES3_9ANNE|nr:hypothetical protein LSH36_12g26014 [Paralvinella palmiformis]